MPSERITLVQGQAYVTRNPQVEVTTILGSCVSICLHDPKARAGGINHFLLSGADKSDTRSLRYGLHAFEQLFNAMLKCGATRETLVARVFGGMSSNGLSKDIAHENALFAENVLREEKVHIAAGDVGGDQARKLLFKPHTGQVMMRYLK